MRCPICTYLYGEMVMRLLGNEKGKLCYREELHDKDAQTEWVKQVGQPEANPEPVAKKAGSVNNEEAGEAFENWRQTWAYPK